MFSSFPTKVQLIKRQASEQWYLNFPSAIAQAMEFSRGEEVEWIVEDKSLLALRRPSAPPPVLKKNSSLLEQFQALWRQCSPSSGQTLDGRAELLALSSLLCLGRHTVTGLLSTCGPQFQDWSARYRLFSHARFDDEVLFAGMRSACLSQLPTEAPVCLAVDDSLLPKRGSKIPGVAWRRDPQGGPFQTNLIRAQRVLQFSAVVPLGDSAAIRAIPVAFLHAPTLPKLASNASAEQQQEHQQTAAALNLSMRALQQWEQRKSTFAGRRVLLLSDARFTTQRFLKGPPDLKRPS